MERGCRVCYYANVIRNMLHLAGLPVTDEMVKLGNKPSTSLKIKSLLKIATPSNRTKLKMILDKCVEEGLPTT